MSTRRAISWISLAFAVGAIVIFIVAMVYRGKVQIVDSQRLACQRGIPNSLNNIETDQGIQISDQYAADQLEAGPTVKGRARGAKLRIESEKAGKRVLLRVSLLPGNPDLRKLKRLPNGKLTPQAQAEVARACKVTYPDPAILF